MHNVGSFETAFMSSIGYWSNLSIVYFLFSVNPWGLNLNPQQLALGQPVMGDWNGFSGIGPFRQFGQQPAVVPQFGVGFGQPNAAQQIYQPTLVQETKVADTGLTSGIAQQGLIPSESAVATTENRDVKQDVCYNIIDSVYPLFSMYCSVLPQTAFSLPNFFGHQTKQEAHELFITLEPAIYSRCSAYVRLFLCPLFFPPCNVEPILPCANFCRAIQHRCGDYGLSSINCDRLPETSEFCPTIIGPNRLIYGDYKFHQSTSHKKHNTQQPDSNYYSDSSSLVGSPSTSDSSNNKAGQTETKTDLYYGEKISGVGSDYSIVNVKPVQAQNVMPDTPDLSKTNTDGSINQQWTGEGSSGASSSTGGSFRATENLIRSGGSSSANTLGSGQGSSIDHIYYGAPTYIPNSNFGSPYGNNENYRSGSSDTDIMKSVDSSLYDRNNNNGGASSNSDATKYTDYSFVNNKNYVGGLSDSSKTASADSSLFGRNDNSGDESGSIRNFMKPVGSTSNGGESSSGDSVTSVDSSFYRNNEQYGGGSSYGDTIKSSGSLQGSSMKSGGSSSSQDSSMKSGGSSSSQDSSMKSGGSSSIQGSSMRSGGSSSQDSSMKSGGSSSLQGSSIRSGGSSSSQDSSMKSGGSSSLQGSSIRSGGSSSSQDSSMRSGGSSSSQGSIMKPGGSSSLQGNTMQSVDSSSSVGNNNNYGGRSSSTGNAFKSVGSTSHSSSGSHGGASYGRSGSYGSINTLEQTGLPYGIQSTADYPTYYLEKLDLSKCGPQPPPKNPCTMDGPQLHPIPGYPHCYIQCALEKMFVKPCPPDLVWNPLIPVCDWPTVHYSGDGNNYDSSSYGTNTYQSGSSYSYGRKKRSTIERKKLFRTGNPFPSLTKMNVPLGPSVPGVVPLPGFTGPIGIAGPLVPPPTPPAPAAPSMFHQIVPRMYPIMLPPYLPMPSPMFPQQVAVPQMPQPMFPQAAVPQLVFVQPTVPQPMFPQPTVPQPMVPQQTVSQRMFPQPVVPQLVFPQPTVPQLMFPQPTIPQVMLPQPTVPQLMFQPSQPPPSTPTLPPFMPPIFPSLPIPLNGPLLPPLPMKIPATFISGPPPIFGAPWFGPFDQPAESARAPVGQPFGFGFGGGFPFAPNFYGGFQQQLPFPYNYYSFKKHGDKGGNKNDYDEDNDYDAYDDEKSLSSDDDDSDNSKPMKHPKNSKAQNDDRLKRKKREYNLNNDQDTSLSVTNEQQPSFNSINQPLNQESLCIGKTMKTNIPHPTDTTKYISCLNENKYEIMDCPTDFIYNALIDQCEINKNTETICEQQNPCMNDGQCYPTSSTTYKCICQGAWTGERCETPLSSCALNPCGEGNECHSLITSDHKQDYICICNKQQSYGLTCARNTVPNPCMGVSTDEEQYYPFAFSVHAFIQCDGDLLHIRPCAAGLYWNQENKICDREETSPTRSIEDQSQSYQINYNTQQLDPTYNRPSANSIDQIVDKQQGYRYRNYNPYTTSNYLRYNQIHMPKDTPMVYSYFPPLPMIKDNRRFKNQHDYNPVDMHVIIEDQKPMLSDEQFSQSYNQLPTNSFMQSTPQRNMFRVFQPSSSRIINSLNTQSTSSSYRR
ncbi:unnamed protein product [Rotaria sp. Silwood2]|nr:unnamed protein product [Rotaria sp. Silwood2]